MERIPVGVIGVGMVGTPTARYFREVQGYERGRDLFLYDIDPRKGFFDDVNRATVVFVCVPTPKAPDGRANLAAVESAFQMLTPFEPERSSSQIGEDAGMGEVSSVFSNGVGRVVTGQAGQKIVVIRSTVPPGTTEDFQKRYPGLKVLFNPENLTERFAWEDFLRPDTQIVGFTGQSVEVAHLVLSLLPKAPFMSPWGLDTYQRIAITATEAEVIKYARNVHFARKVNFANVLAALSEKLGITYENVRRGMAADHRIGDSHLDVTHGGYRGFGGYCFPKDLDAFIAKLDDLGLAEHSALLKRDRQFNVELLAAQGLSLEDVSVHDHEWITKKLAQREDGRGTV
ncbi:MAG: hypothetical protein AAB591_00715 [Patescibacteria group bacterium]